MKHIGQVMKGYALTLKLLQQQANSKVKTDHSKIFTTFNQQCYQPFYQKVLQFEICDGMWVAPFLDHLTALLCKFAILADANTDSSAPVIVDNENEEDDEPQENRHIELAQQEMNKLNQQLRSSKPGYDNRKFAQFFIQVRIVRVWFKLNNYK